LKSYVFQDVNNPFALDFPESLIVPSLTSSITNGDFVAIKVGDVNQSLGSVIIRGSTAPYLLSVEDKLLEKGKTYDIPVRMNASAAALQYAIGVDKNAARLEGITKGDLPNANDNSFGVFKNEGIVTAAWNQEANQKLSESETYTMVNLTIKPTINARLSDILSLNPVYTEGVAYDAVGTGKPVKLSFGNNGKASDSDKLTLLPNTPNPFSGQTTIAFLMPEESVAKLTVCDILGKIVMATEKTFAKGLNQVVFNAQSTLSSGMLIVRLQTNMGMAEQKIVLNR
jgi:hypothetical protein